MLQAITPNDDIYNYRRNLTKKSYILQNQLLRKAQLPIIKIYKDQMTATDDIKTCFNFNKNKNNKNNNETTLLINLLKNAPSSITSISNIVTNNSNQINSKFYFNKNFKLKSIPQRLVKSNSTSNINSSSSNNTNRSLTILNFPGKILKNSSSLPKLNIKEEYFENNKCNYLILKYRGIDNSKNEIKKKKYMVLNSHKIINSLKSISMPNDNYGTKLIDIIQQRINSGYYQKYKFYFKQKYQTISMNQTYEKKPENMPHAQNNDEKKFDGLFLKDIYDDNLLPGLDNKYNYTVHKIFLSQILENVTKRMVEIRDKDNKIITKEEIRKEYCNEVNNLRDTLLTGKDFEIINKIYNINNNMNIINIQLGNRENLNDMDIIEESIEYDKKDKLGLINTTLEGRDKDKQNLTSHLFSNISRNKNNNDEVANRKKNLENIESKFKALHKTNNIRLLSDIKNKIKIKNKSLSIHDSFLNLYFHKRPNSADLKEEQISSNYDDNESEKENDYYIQEDQLNNVDKFILNTKKLRYTFDIKDKKEKEKRNFSYDSEGNIINYFDVGLKLNPVFFDDIYDELEEQYNINNNIKEKKMKNEMIREILSYFINKKGIKLKFNDKYSKKYLSLLFGKKSEKNKKNKKKKKNIKKQSIHLIQEMSKKMHKKIQIQKIRNLSIDDIHKKKKIKHKKNTTEDNFWQKNKRLILIEHKNININKNLQLYTENNYLEIETNSSQFSDIPSELDSEIYDMIKKKQEKEKNKDKDVEEGIYAQQDENKNKGGDFIISRPPPKKEKTEKIKEKKEIIEEIKKKEEEEKKVNIKNFLNFNENNEIEMEKKKKMIQEKNKADENNKNKSNINKEKVTEKEKEKIKEKEREQKLKEIKPKIDTNNIAFNRYKDIKIKANDNKNININNITNNINTTKKSELDKNKNKSKNEDLTTPITPRKKYQDSVIKDIKKPPNKTEKKKLEKITEEENKESKINNDKTPEKKKEIKSEKKEKKIEKPKMSIYKNIKIDKEKSQKENLNEEIFSDNSINKGYPFNEDKDKSQNNINDSNIIIPTTDNLSMMGIINTISNKKDKNSTDNSKIQEMKNMEEEFEEAEDEDDEIFKQKLKKINTFHSEKNYQKMKLELSEFEEDKESIKESKRRNSVNIDQSKNYMKIKHFLEKHNKGSLKKQEVEEEYEDEEENEKIEEEEEHKEERKIKKKRRRVTLKKDFKRFFIDENAKKEEKKEKVKPKETIIIPEKDEWEKKFIKFKLYIHKLKAMNQEEFKYNLFKFLEEDEKIDFTQREKINKVDRINKYKAFINTSKANKLIYNRFHSSHILFAPGCIFNTGGIFNEN